jgi:hypothetical protein
MMGEGLVPADNKDEISIRSFAFWDFLLSLISPYETNYTVERVKSAIFLMLDI